jgi:phage shock protein A
VEEQNMGFFSNFFGRAGRVSRGQVNKGMDAVEDATFEATVKQAVRDMKTELNKVVRSSAEAMSNYNRLEAEYQKYVRQADDWQERAKKALEANNEELAKKALAKKKECTSQVESLQTSVDSARETSSSLKSQMRDLKGKIEAAERNAGTLIARKNAAKAQKKVAQALAGVGEADNAFAALSSFEESVARDEASAKAFESLSGDADSDLEAEFAKLDTSSVDSDLEALKKKLGK